MGRRVCDERMMFHGEERKLCRVTAEGKGAFKGGGIGEKRLI